MSLTLHLSPELEKRLREEAEQRGLKLEEWLEQDLEARWGGLEPDPSESVLLLTATRGLPDSFWLRYRQLIAKREAEALTESERAELMALSDQAEALRLQRTRALLQLARLRGVGVSQLQKQLGLSPMPLYA